MRSRNQCCSGKAISITYYECVSVALSIRCTMRLRRITLLTTLPHKRQDFREKKKSLNTKCVF